MPEHNASLKSNAWGVHFPVTEWTRIESAQAGDAASRDDMYCRYATPVFCYLRALGADHETAKDLTQDVFVKLMGGKLLGSLRPRESRFRSYLGQIVKNQWRSHLQAKNAKKRRAETNDIRLDEVIEKAGPYFEPATDERPESIFDRRYARELLYAAVQRVQSACETDGLAAHFAVFAGRYLENPALSWEQAGTRQGVTDQKARNMAKTVEARLGKELREVICSECGDPDEATTEIHRFIELLNKREA